MFDPMLFSPGMGQFGLGPSNDAFSTSSNADTPLFSPGDDNMRLSGPPATSDTLSMSAHRSLFTMGDEPSGLKRSMSSAVLSDLGNHDDSDFFFRMKKKNHEDGKQKSDDTSAPQPLGLRSSSSCPNLQQLQSSDTHDQESSGDATDKIKKRKARKAEVARQCRKRKKAYIQSLEEKAKLLAEKLSALSNKRHKSGNLDDFTQHRNDQQKLLDKMQKLVNKSSSDDVGKELKSCVTSFTNNSRRRQKSTISQLQSLKAALDPGVDTKFALWLLHQNTTFCNSELWKGMNREVKLTKSQMNKLHAHRSRAFELQSELRKLTMQVDAFQKSVAKHLQTRHEILDQITSKILNPKQTAKLLLWVQNNPSCMEVLDTIWKNQAVKEEKRGGRSGRATRRSMLKAKREFASLDMLPQGGPFGTALDASLGGGNLLSGGNVSFDSQKILGKDSLLSSLQGFMDEQH